MESRSTGVESPTPAEHEATVALHSEAKLCRSPGQRVQIGQLLGCSPFTGATRPGRGAGVFPCAGDAAQSLHDACICWVCSPAPASRSTPGRWCRAGSGQILFHDVRSRHRPFVHPVLPARGHSDSIATNTAFLKELQTATATRCEWLGLCSLFLTYNEFEKQKVLLLLGTQR